MSTPFEDLEYLADFLPDEGETMLVTRHDGELTCEPFRRDSDREGISDPEFYGRLVQASERLSVLGTIPVCICLISWFWLCVAFHVITGIRWSGWFLDVGLGIMIFMGCLCWIRFLEKRLFRSEIRPMLESEIRRHGLRKYAVIGAIRQHPEMQSLMSELSHWTDDTARLGPLDS